MLTTEGAARATASAYDAGAGPGVRAEVTAAAGPDSRRPRPRPGASWVITKAAARPTIAHCSRKARVRNALRSVPERGAIVACSTAAPAVPAGRGAGAPGRGVVAALSVPLN